MNLNYRSFHQAEFKIFSKYRNGCSRHGIVKDVADLIASLQFSQNDTSKQQEKIVSIAADDSSLQETVNKCFQKTIYLEN